MAGGDHQRDRASGLDAEHKITVLTDVPPPDHTTPAENDLLRPEDSTNDGSQPIKDGLCIDNARSDVDRPVDALSPLELSNDAEASAGRPSSHIQSDGDDDRTATANSSLHSASLPPPLRGKIDAAAEKVDEDGVRYMHKFWLYETARRFYVVGGDVMEGKFRLLKLDRAAESGDLSIAEDDIVYTKKDMNQLLDTLDDGNKASGGMTLRYSFWGLLGFVRFTGAYYMLLITKRSQVAVMGGHYIYQIDGIELVSLTVSAFRSKVEKDPEEARFIGILNNLDLTRSFYFSYSYDITRTLQRNILRERQALRSGHTQSPLRDYNSMFVWNHHFLRPATAALKTAYDWCLPIIHGFVDQAKVSTYGRKIYITIIARRSRFYAGARFLKRGANDLGYVANDVETEQVVSDMLTTSFHAPGPEFFANPNYTSYVQHRGSIPLYWTQDSSGVSPKPDIELNLVDPFYSAAALHFDDLFERYGSPIYVLNLIKSRERTPRESILLREYGNAISYLNQFLPAEQRIRYKAWDMSRASKSQDQDVIGTLESIAEDVMTLTGFFRNGSHGFGDLKVQNGVARTNCIDCLDRTNAAQFVIGKRALSHQLHALGIIDDTSMDYDTDAVNLFTEMFHNHGDTIAVQYGGSHLVNTMATYRKINQWTSQPRDVFESVKRYYNNSFLDKQRQEAYNLFLGNYIFAQGQPMLWDLSTDYYLHHADPRAWFARKRRSYQKWFTPENLLGLQMPDATQPQGVVAGKPLNFFDEWWVEYYRPHQMTHYVKLLPYKMTATNNPENEDKSPFRIRDGHESGSPAKLDSKKGHRIMDPTIGSVQKGTSQIALSEHLPPQHGVLKGSPLEVSEANPKAGKVPNEKKAPKDKSAVTQWTLDQFVTNSLDPLVPNKEAYEYQRYVNHPLNLPLVVSTDIPPNANMELLNYVNSISVDAMTDMQSAEDDLTDYDEFLDIGEDPLTVTEADTAKKRYKAYRQWVKGKSLFKQRVDP